MISCQLGNIKPMLPKKTKHYSVLHRVNNVFKLPVWVKLRKKSANEMDVDMIEENQKLMQTAERLLAVLHERRQRDLLVKSKQGDIDIQSHPAGQPPPFRRPVWRP